MKYIDYSVDDFLIDPKFKEWILSPNPDSDHYWQSFLQQYPEKRNEIFKARKIISGMHFPMPDGIKKYGDEELEQMFDEVLNSKKSDNSSNNHRESNSFRLWNKLNWTFRAAAILTGGLVAAVMWLTIQSTELQPEISEFTHITKKAVNGQKLTVVLPDGTGVKLNSGSEISYREPFDSVRAVQLSGEAFFEVSRDEAHPFHVMAGELTTIVLGTKFGVSYYPEEANTNVMLVEGKINVVKDVQSGGGLSHILKPSEMISYTSGQEEFTVSKFNYRSQLGWKDDLLVFNNNSFDEVIAKLEKWYGVDFVLSKEVRSKKDFSAEYQGEPLENVLNGIAYTFDFSFQINEKTITIN